MSGTRQVISATITVEIALRDRYSELCLVAPDGTFILGFLNTQLLRSIAGMVLTPMFLSLI